MRLIENRREITRGDKRTKAVVQREKAVIQVLMEEINDSIDDWSYIQGQAPRIASEIVWLLDHMASNSENRETSSYNERSGHTGQ